MSNLNEIPETAEEIRGKLEELAGSSILSTASNFQDISHSKNEIINTCTLGKEWLDRISNFDNNKVGEDVQENIEKTYNSLLYNFEKASVKLHDIGISPQDISQACIGRLLDILEEVSNGNRKLTNGDVLCLESIQDGKLHTRTIGYYEFACCNVSLDEVIVQGKTLRDISNLCKDTNDKGDFLLPNSFGVSISLMAQNNEGKPVFIGQFRNNATTLTQRDTTKVVSAASGAIDTGQEFVDMGKIELNEELGLAGSAKGINNNVRAIMTGIDTVHTLSISNPLSDELGMQDADIEIGGIVFEDLRRNPELVLRATTTKTDKEIENLWQGAKDRSESTGIRGVNLEEIGDNLSGEKKHFRKTFSSVIISLVYELRFKYL